MQVRSLMLVRAVMRLARELHGRIRAPGRIWCTIDPRILPQAQILPDKWDW